MVDKMGIGCTRYINIDMKPLPRATNYDYKLLANLQNVDIVFGGKKRKIAKKSYICFK